MGGLLPATAGNTRSYRTAHNRAQEATRQGWRPAGYLAAVMCYDAGRTPAAKCGRAPGGSVGSLPASCLPVGLCSRGGGRPVRSQPPPDPPKAIYLRPAENVVKCTFYEHFLR